MQSSRSAREASDAARLDHARRVRRWSIEDFHRTMREAGILRAYVMYENGRFFLSHEELRPIEAFLELSHDFAEHEAIFLAPSPDRFRTVFAAFVHDTRRGLAQGGLRLWPYATLADLLADGLRLSQGMTRKNALAGLDWGGGKGIISLPPYVENAADYYSASEERAELFAAYGAFVASLDGVYYTAEDVGTVTADMNRLLAANRFTTCIGVDRGGSGNPSAHTAWGVYRAMMAAWGTIAASESLAGVTVAVQGAGNVGGPLIQYLHRAGARLLVADVAPLPLEGIRTHYPDVTIVPDIFAVKADIFAPCALGNVVNRDTIPKLETMGVRLVCGAANNQLGEPQDAEVLASKRIRYVPDYLCNRMGITNCADEWMGYLQQDVQLATERVYHDTLRVFRYAQKVGVSTATAANRLADAAAALLHPLMKHRGRRIQDHLRDIHWEKLDLDARAKEASNKWWDAGTPQWSRKVRFIPSAHEPLMHRAAERDGAFSGVGPAIAATPISTAGRPHLGVFLSTLLMDVAARARGREGPRRVVSLDHGGIALQNAVEETMPYALRDEAMLDHLRLECADFHGRNGAEVRHQLEQTGIGFDAGKWFDPMSAEGKEVVTRVYHRLADLGRVARDTSSGHVQWRCPACATVVPGETVFVPGNFDDYRVSMKTLTGEPIIAHVARLEYVPFAVAIAVRDKGPYATAAKRSATHPLDGYDLPIHVSRRELPQGVDAELIVPGSSTEHGRFCREYRLPTQLRIYEAGRVRIDGRLEDREVVIKDVRERLGTALSVLSKDGGVVRCRRCLGPVDPDESPQVMLDLVREVADLTRLIEADAVHFSSASAKAMVLNQLRTGDPICISRQGVWGNELPDGSEDVLSPYFSMTALALHAAGWPAEAEPDPIDTVFTDPGFLGRWVVPAQLIALAIYGRPLFKNVHVHGSVHVVQRLNEDVASAATYDEERYLYRTTERPMRRRVGNTVEPASLIQRFGADALRLWHLLALRSGTPRTVLREELAGRARQQVNRLNVVLSFLLESTRDSVNASQLRVLDSLAVARIAELADLARAAYEPHAYERAARAFLDAVELAANYAKWASEAAAAPDDAATRATTVVIVRELERGFAPICPFILERFAAEVRTSTVDMTQVHAWARDFVSLLSMKGRPVRIGVLDAEIRAELPREAAAVRAVLGVAFELVDELPDANDRVVGSFFRKVPREGV